MSQEYKVKSKRKRKSIEFGEECFDLAPGKIQILVFFVFFCYALCLTLLFPLLASKVVYPAMI